MAKLDSFTLHRIIRFARTFRESRGQLPTGADFEKEGISSEQLDRAVKEQALEQLYVTLTNGAIVKGYKAKQ